MACGIRHDSEKGGLTTTCCTETYSYITLESNAVPSWQNHGAFSHELMNSGGQAEGASLHVGWDFRRDFRQVPCSAELYEAPEPTPPSTSTLRSPSSAPPFFSLQASEPLSSNNRSNAHTGLPISPHRLIVCSHANARLLIRPLFLTCFG